MAKKHTIWDNDIATIEAIAKDLIEEDGVDEDNATESAYEVNAEFLEDEKANLNIDVSEEILIIADLGLWFGRRQAYKFVNSSNIRDCLNTDGMSGDLVKFYVENGNLKCRDSHHDGVNYYTYRSWRPGLSGVQKENFLEKVYHGKATPKDITRYTQGLGKRIADVYGW